MSPGRQNEFSVSTIVRAGWLPNTSVRELVVENRETFLTLPFVLVSCVDSGNDVASQTWARAELDRDPGWAISVDPLVITGPGFIGAVDGPLTLAGFDEIWIPSRLPIAQRPDAAHIMAPRLLKRGASIRRSVATWMARSGCRLGLGDGFGLNYIVGDEDLAKLLGLPAT